MYRPNIDPTDAIGSQFEPFNVPKRPFKVHSLHVSPLEPFEHFFLAWLVESWADYTNRNSDTAGRRILRSVAEIYVRIGMIICIYLNLVKLYKSSWKGPKVGQNAMLS